MEIELFISIGALLAALFGLGYSRKAIKVSESSLEIQNRPWLLIEFKRNEETKNFYDIVKKYDGIFWKFSVDIVNKGNTPAINIFLPDTFNIKDIDQVDEKLGFKMDDIVLGQGQKYRYTFWVGGIPKNNSPMEDMLEKYGKNKKGIELLFVMHYQGLINEDKEYRTKIRFSVENDNVSILTGSEYT